MKTRILSYLLVFSMILALLPASALAEGESTTTPYITATVKHALDSGGAETGQITAQIEAYLTDKDNQSRTVKPCDIIFLIEQSTFMNTQNDTTQYGQERADILNSMENLLQNLPAPTTGEHRVAIAGFGRINNSGSSDSYIESQHPGARLSVTQNPSLNTGYYTCENNAPVFHSQSGWTEWDRITDPNDTTLPQMPEGYLTNESYDNVFMSIDKAKNVIDVDKMVSWHAGASRMDAGLQITEQLAKIAQAHKANSKDRNLIIFVAASSLPYQNGVGVQNLRPEAAQAAAQPSMWTPTASSSSALKAARRRSSPAKSPSTASTGPYNFSSIPAPLRAVRPRGRFSLLPAKFVENPGFPTVFHTWFLPGSVCGKLLRQKFQRGEALLPQARNAAENKFLASTFFSKKAL